MTRSPATPLSQSVPLDPTGGDFPQSLRSEARRLLDAGAGPRALAYLLLQAVDGVPLLDLARAAMALRMSEPLDRMVWSLTDDLIYTQVPRWHWPMLQDETRADCYRRAIEASVEPGMLVLEIGTGTGLLAMMAAKAGAGHVFTVESNPLMADVARACIAQNGLSDQITVLTMSSHDLKVGRDMPRRADLLVHEVLSSNVLTEGLGPTMDHALAELVTADAPLLPDFIGIEAALSGDLTDTGVSWWGVEGFDLTPLVALDAASHGVPGPRERRRLSAPVGVAEMNLRRIDWAQQHTYIGSIIADAPGLLSGVEQWMKVRFPCGTLLDSSAPSSHWGTSYHPFAASQPIEAGQPVGIEVTFDSRQLSIGLSQDELPLGEGWRPGL